MYKQRDIVLIPFPYTDLTGTKLRPAVIISNKRLNETEDRMCCLITSKPSQEGLEIKEFEKGKLPFQSWVKPHRIFTIDKKIVKRKLCTINKDFQKKIVQEMLSFVKIK